MNKFFENKYIRLMILTIIIAAFLLSINYLIQGSHLFTKWFLKAFIPVIIGLIMAVVFEPVVKYLERRKVNRSVSAVFLILIVNLLLAFILAEGIVILINACLDIVANLQKIDYLEIYNYFNSLTKRFQTILKTVPTPLVDIVQSGISELTSILNQVATVSLKLMKVVPITFKGITIWFFACLSAFFFIRDRAKMSRWFIENFSMRLYKETSNIVFKVLNSVIDYAKSQIILSLLMFITGYIGLSIIRAPYVLIVSLLLGVLSIIPIIGSGIILLPWIFYELIAGHQSFGIKLLIVYLIILTLREFVSIKIVATNVGISTFTTLVSIYAGVEIFGPWGFVIGPLFVVFLKAIYDTGLIKNLRENIFKNKGSDII